MKKKVSTSEMACALLAAVNKELYKFEDESLAVGYTDAAVLDASDIFLAVMVERLVFYWKDRGLAQADVMAKSDLLCNEVTELVLKNTGINLQAYSCHSSQN